MSSINLAFLPTMAKLEISSLLEMSGLVGLYIESIKDDPIYGPNQELWDPEFEEATSLREMKEFSAKLCVVGLYMLLERYTKKIISFIYFDADEKTREKRLRSLYKWDRLVSELNISASIRVAELPEFATISELRCLNNAIKHGDYVDDELAKFPTWQGDLNNEIKIELIDLNRYGDAVPLYLEDMVSRIKKRLVRTS